MASPIRYQKDDDFPTRIMRCVENFEPARDMPDTARAFGPDWRALVFLFKALDFRSADDVWGGALAVYGWMPRMLKHVHYETELSEIARDIRSVCGEYEPKLASFNNELGEQSLEALKKARNRCNGVLTALETTGRKGKTGRTLSVVGTSKLLHFVAPHVLPIWDQRVANALAKSGRHRDEEVYLNYVEGIHQSLHVGLRAPRFVQERLDEAAKMSVPEVRALEFTLFLMGG